MISIVLTVLLRFTDSDYPFGIYFQDFSNLLVNPQEMLVSERDQSSMAYQRCKLP
jgi:hypothetical protein